MRMGIKEFTTSRRKAFRAQPVSRSPSPRSLERTLFAKRDMARRSQESCLRARTPATMSQSIECGEKASECQQGRFARHRQG